MLLWFNKPGKVISEGFSKKRRETRNGRNAPSKMVLATGRQRESGASSLPQESAAQEAKGKRMVANLPGVNLFVYSCGVSFPHIWIKLKRVEYTSILFL